MQRRRSRNDIGLVFIGVMKRSCTLLTEKFLIFSSTFRLKSVTLGCQEHTQMKVATTKPVKEGGGLSNG